VADQSAPQFRRAVIALSGGRTDRSIVALAVELARPAKAELVGVHVVEIDWTLPLDADVAGRSEDAQRVLDIAETTAEAGHYELETVLLQARDVGAAIVDEATEREADLIICGLPFRRRFGGDFAIGRTIPYVLRNAPCAVWVAREAMTEEQA
jgi:nucleotide-binding universal stress UspA family protein